MPFLVVYCTTHGISGDYRLAVTISDDNTDTLPPVHCSDHKRSASEIGDLNDQRRSNTELNTRNNEVTSLLIFIIRLDTLSCLTSCHPLR